MKKKILSIALVVCIAITAIAGATLAYLTDTDDATNVFTVGNVQIELVEQQRSYDDEGKLEDELVDFEDNKILLPIVGSAQGEKDSFGMPTAANYVDKIVTVNNIGQSDAYIRVIVAVPSALDWSDGPLHWNLGNNFVTDYSANFIYDEEVSWKLVREDVEITVDGETYEDLYNIYTFTYATPVNGSVYAAANEDAVTSTPFAAIVGFYLDSSVDNYVNDNGEIVYTFNGKDINYDLTKGVTVPVFAQAVQSAGFATAEEAFKAATQLPTNPWAADIN